MSELQFQFAMYNPETNTVEFNVTVSFDDPNDIVYLFRLAEEQPLTYAKFALSDTGLQDYVNAMNWFNY